MLNRTEQYLLALNDPGSCTIDICNLEDATIQYLPNLAGNAFFAALFGLLCLGQIGMGIRYKTWGFMVALVPGLILEVVGYVSRILMHNNPWLSNPFLIYIITVTIAPCFFTAGIYLCLSRIIIVYGEEFARFKPRTYTIIFICCDFFSLVLQGAGGGIADTANDQATTQIGINIMIAGLAFQVASLTLFAALCADFAWAVLHTSGYKTMTRFPCDPKWFYAFIISLASATVFVYIRSCFRVAELQGGFHGVLASDEITYMVLEAAMIALTGLALTVFHPGPIYGNAWKKGRVVEINTDDTEKAMNVKGSKGSSTVAVSQN